MLSWDKHCLDVVDDDEREVNCVSVLLQAVELLLLSAANVRLVLFALIAGLDRLQQH